MIEIVWSDIIKSKEKRIDVSSSILDVLTKDEKINFLEKREFKKIKKLPNTEESYHINLEIAKKLYNERQKKMEEFYYKHGIDEKYLQYAKDNINRKIKKGRIENRQMKSIMQSLTWERFFIKAEWKEENQDVYLSYEIRIDKNGKLERIQRHTDDNMKIENMVEYMLEWKDNILNKIPEYKDIDMVFSWTWLGDRDFIQRRKEKRSEEGKEPWNIINLYEQEENYTEYLEDNTREKWFRKKHISKNSTLRHTIEEYEKNVRPLKEGKRIINLNKMENRNKEHKIEQ